MPLSDCTGQTTKAELAAAKSCISSPKPLLSHSPFKMPVENIIQRYSQTVGERTEIDEIMTIALLLQRFFGHQILDPQWTWRNFCHYQIFTLLLIIYVFFGTLGIINSNGSDSELIAEACYTLVLIVLCPIKLLLFINNREVFRDLYRSAKTSLFQIIKEHSERIHRVLNTARRAVYALLGMVVVPVTTYELAALYYYIKGNRILLSRSTDTLMPFTSPYYEIAWFLHSIFLTEMSSIIIVTDMWFVFLMHFLSLASDCLVKVLLVEPKGKREGKTSYAKRLNSHLKQFYETHVKLIQFISKLSKMYKWLAFIPLVNAAMCICIVLLVISKEINWKFVPHILPLFGEIFAFSWFGEQLKTKMHNLEVAVLNFDWMNLERVHKKNYFIIVSFMNKNFGIRTAVGNDLSLITMTKVLKGSYQAYTVLQSVD